MRSRVLLGLAFASALFGCGASVTPPAASRAPAASPAEDGWKETTWEERHATMTWGVLPAMARRFQAFRREDDPSLTCRTCHGSDAEERAYAMPNRELAPLRADRLPGPEVSPIARFMQEEVVPTMRELTEDPTLSCFTCHPHAEGDAR